MARVYYVHWHEDECRTNIAALEHAGHQVESHWSTQKRARIGPGVEALVISLERLPSHGRAIAEWFWEAKSRRSRPIVFVGGKPEKVRIVRAKFPDAVFCNHDELIASLTTALKAEQFVTDTPSSKPRVAATRGSRLRGRGT